MSILGDSVKTARRIKKLSQADLAAKAGVSQTTISDIERGRNDSSKELPKIAKALGALVEELLTGRFPPTQFIRVEAWDSSTPLDDDEVEIPFYKDFLVACGHGSNGEALDTETRRLRLSKATLRGKTIDKNNAVAVTATDDSMSPTINDGNTVYLDLGRTSIKNGKVFVVEFDGQDGKKVYRCKRLYSLPMGGVRVVSDNADEYPEERFTAEQQAAMNFRIVGWAFSWQTLETW